MERNCGNSGSARGLAANGTARTSRRNLIGRVALASAAAVGGYSLLSRDSSSAATAPSVSQDERIFNFALLLEYLQAGFYADAVDHGRLKGEVREFAEVVAGHEREHVSFLRKALGSNARRRPSFDFGDATKDERKFLAKAVVLENTGVAAYNGQAANLTKPALAAAAEIVSVEGRHAAWVSDLAGVEPAPRAADVGASAAAVVAAIKATRFLQAT
jgi:rubrerythrin